MPNNIKWVCQLQQHTPLLHFQYHHDGACLRATEVKPRVDQYIIEKLTGLTGEAAANRFKETHPGWLVGHGKAEHVALDYKMQIKAIPDEHGKYTTKEYLVASSVAKRTRVQLEGQGVDLLTFAPYFADNERIKNMKLDEARRGVVYHNIQLSVICLNQNLLNELRESLPYVFAHHNFGLRGSKGFGCFTVAATGKTEFESMILQHAEYRQGVFVYNVPTNPRRRLTDIFRKIDQEYKILKSGMQKVSSQMEEYFAEKGIEWEKPTLKKELVNNRNPRGLSDYAQDQKIKYIRALLGVAELYEFPKQRAKIKIECLDKDEEGKSAIIERFRSPITFKVFDNSIYLLPGKIDEAIYGKRFQFSTSRGKVIISTPDREPGFNLNEFLERHVDNTWEILKPK